jgi:hypothetical protein
MYTICSKIEDFWHVKIFDFHGTKSEIWLHIKKRSFLETLEFDDLLEDSNVFVDLQDVILVFDKGYWKLDRFKVVGNRRFPHPKKSFGFFRKLDESGYRFVTSMKINTKYEVLSGRMEKDISDEIVKLSNASRKLKICACRKSKGFLNTRYLDL